MPDYRLYFLDAMGHIRRAVNIVRDDDEQAISAVDDYSHSHEMELWELGRQVKVFPGALNRSPSQDPG